MRVLSGVISDDLADTLVTQGSQKHRYLERENMKEKMA